MAFQETNNAQTPSTRESVEFRTPQAPASGQIEIQIVVVPPNKPGEAYGHDEVGNCLVVRSETDLMLDLFHRLREAGRGASPAKVFLTADDRLSITSIERTACPLHALPEIPEGSAVPWAPY